MAISLAALLPLLVLTASPGLPKYLVPNFSDLTIQTRRTDEFGTTVERLYLKGARQRSEYVKEHPISYHAISINQCDRKVTIHLNPQQKLFAETPIMDWTERVEHARQDAKAQAQATLWGPEVKITINNMDTGERKQVGGYTAWHVKTTITTEAPPEASLHSSVEERDGWYIDLVGLGCSDEGRSGTAFSFLTTAPAGKPDHIELNRIGGVTPGFALEQSVRKTENGKVTTSRIEMLEFSRATLDSSLFERPPDYSEALHTPHGGFDLTRPDTLGNRVHVYWAELKSSVRGLL